MASSNLSITVSEPVYEQLSIPDVIYLRFCEIVPHNKNAGVLNKWLSRFDEQPKFNKRSSMNLRIWIPGNRTFETIQNNDFDAIEQAEFSPAMNMKFIRFVSGIAIGVCSNHQAFDSL